MGRILFTYVLIILFLIIDRITCFDDDELKKLFKVEVLTPGDNTNYPKTGNKLILHYTGTFVETKKKFDSSYDRNETATIIIGKKIMIECWERVVPKISLGEKVYFVCPHSLAYGTQGVKGKVPPRTNLAFEVELIQIIDGNFDEL